MVNKSFIKRDLYTERIRPFIDKNVIKVFVGQRRVGKSFVMKQTADEIINANPNANIIFIDKELFEYSEIKNASDLYEYVTKQLNSEKNYLFVDEIQEIENFELALRSLLNENKCDIYCSGSNAKMLSGELATHLSGRYIAINVYSLNYREYIKFNNLNASNETLKNFLTYGGMPFLVNLPNDKDVIFEYLKNIYSTILLKDIIAHQQIKNIAFIESLVNFLADNVGSIFSAKSICDYLKAQKINMTIPTLQNYIKSLCDSYVIHRVQRIDIQGLKIFEIGEKYYFEDFGIRNTLRNSNFSTDINKLIENVVYKELLTRKYTVHIGKLKNKEIDFIAENQSGRIYVQCCYLLSSENVIEREFGNLEDIKDNYPKYVVSMDDYPCTNNYQGIKQIHLKDFLLLENL